MIRALPRWWIDPRRREHRLAIVLFSAAYGFALYCIASGLMRVRGVSIGWF